MIEILKRMLSFFDKKDKKVLYLLLLCFVVIGVFEMLSVASIAPFVAVISHPELIASNTILNQVYQIFHFSTVVDFIFFLGILVFVLLVVGNAFSAIAQWALMRFSFIQSHKISTRLLKQYMSESYPFYLNHNRAEMAKNILSDVYKVITGILISGMQALTKLIVVLCIFSLLLIVNPFLALLVGGILGSAYLIFYSLLGKKLSSQGAFASVINGKQYQVVTETLGAIKELKVLGREAAFLEKFKIISKQYAKAESNSIISPQVTRYIIETIAFGGILLIVLYLTRVKEEIAQVLPILALYALAGYRLLPPMQQIFVGMSLAKFYSTSLEIVYSALHDKHCALQWPMYQGEPLTFNQAIYLKNISYQYPSSDVKVIKQIDMKIAKNTVIGLVGVTGSGKTTTVDILLGLLEPTAGEISVDDEILNTDNIRNWQKNLGYVPQTIFLTDASVLHNIALGIQDEKISKEAVIKAAKLANLHDFIIQELPFGYDTMIGEGGNRLSGGQRQRIGIARALYHNPDVLVFDEATSALDGETEQAIIQSIHALSHKKTIIIIAHRLSTVEGCDAIYFFEKGKIIDVGTYQELIVKNSQFRKIATVA